MENSKVVQSTKVAGITLLKTEHSDSVQYVLPMGMDGRKLDDFLQEYSTDVRRAERILKK